MNSTGLLTYEQISQPWIETGVWEAGGGGMHLPEPEFPIELKR